MSLVVPVWEVRYKCYHQKSPRGGFVVCAMDVMDLEPQEIAPQFKAVVVPEDGQGEPYELSLPTDCHLYTSAYHIPPTTPKIRAALKHSFISG